MAALETFLQDLYTNVIEFQLPEIEINAIQSSVEKLVDRLLQQVAVQDPRFKVCNILKVGSYYEKTKICQPDEFDFLVQIEELSDPSKYSQSVNCYKNICSVHVHAKMKEYNKWNPNCKPTGNVFPPQTVHSMFGTASVRAIQSLIESNTNSIETEWGILKILKKSSGSGPNVEIFMTWRNDKSVLNISADITPFIPCTTTALQQWKHVINPSITEMPLVVPPSPSNLYLCKSGEGMLENACWRFSFTPAEVKAMQNLPENHRKCYKILKYLCTGISELPKGPLRLGDETSLKLLSSYILKNAVLYHNDDCDSKKDVHICIKEIIHYLILCAGREFLPNYFIPTRNNWPVQRFTREVMVPNVLQLFHNTLYETMINRKMDSYLFEESHEFLKKIMKRAAIMEKRHIDKYDVKDKGNSIHHREAHVKQQTSDKILGLPSPSYFDKKKEQLETKAEIYDRENEVDKNEESKQTNL